MADQAEYEALKRQRSDAEREYRQRENRIHEYDYLLSRLRPAYRELYDEKHTFREIWAQENKNANEKRDWKGSHYNRFETDANMICEEDRSYHRSLDYTLDALNDEITRIENLRMQEYGILGRLGSWINTLANKIENFFN